MTNKIKAAIVKACNEGIYQIGVLLYTITNATIAENVTLIVLASLPVAAGWTIALY